METGRLCHCLLAQHLQEEREGTEGAVTSEQFFSLSLTVLPFLSAPTYFNMWDVGLESGALPKVDNSQSKVQKKLPRVGNSVKHSVVRGQNEKLKRGEIAILTIILVLVAVRVQLEVLCDAFKRNCKYKGVVMNDKPTQSRGHFQMQRLFFNHLMMVLY